MRSNRILFSLAVLIFIVSDSRVFAAANPADFNEGVRKSDPLSPQEEQKALRVPPGFEVQLVASEPDINKPLNIAFDVSGRLWVNSTVEYPWPAKDPAKARDSLKILSDFGPDGKARKIVTFAEGLNIPIGVLPYGDGAIGHSIPFIYQYSDTKGTGKSDKRTVLLDRIGFQKDTHGMSGNFVRGFDGWVYATHGFNNDSTIKALDGSQIVINSGNTYRFRPDGSHIEQFTWGQVNPFGLALDGLGNLYSCDCHTFPIYQLLRGAYYPSFGKKDDGLGFGPQMMNHLHGSTANCGIVVYTDDRFPAEYRSRVFTGNVMTSKINLDELVDTGTTRTAKELPDFLNSDDPWFRPTSIQLGPDGALYVSDFYNRIIGHYEVPLTHPGRDRERGRIWRIVYKGTPEKPLADKLPPDLTAKTQEELVALTGEPNLTLRLFAMYQLLDRIGVKGADALKAVLKTGTVNQKVIGMWTLFNLKSLTAAELNALATDADRTVRTHAMRAFAETETWTDEQFALVRAAVKDTDPWVRRGAADALARHASAENVKPLVALRQATDAADTHSTHVIRMALRNQLLSKGIYEKIAALNLNESELQTVADVCLGAPTEDSAAILVKYLSTAKETPKDAGKYMEHAIKYLPFGELDALVASARARLGGDLGQQLGLLKSINDGAARRGVTLSPAVRAWAAETIGKVLSSDIEVKQPEWTALTLDGKPNKANPWVAQARASADGKTENFLCSLPLGETLTGIYRSKTFEVPKSLSFYMAGHNGPPPDVHAPKNFIRLREAETNELLMETLPPRNDVAQHIKWDLAKHKGKKAVIELVDGDNTTAFAWLAAGRFSPAVVALPTDGNSIAQKMQAAIDIAAQMKLTEVGPRLAEILSTKKFGDAVRASAAAALGADTSGKNDAVFAAILRDASEGPALRDSAANALGASTLAEQKGVLVEVLQGAPEKFQTKVALALCQSAAGAESLLKTIGEGKASPRLLLNRAVADRLGSLKIADLGDRIAKLTKGLPPANEQIQGVIDARVKAYHAAKDSSIELGAKVFEKNCMVCHQLEGKGKVIGPQLDGVGARGLDRIVEDILDPSRNVDAAFRSSTVKLNSGQVYSGLKRREEGEQVVFADAKGEEKGIDKKEIKEVRETQNSLMPDGFHESIAPGDFNHLLAFLLSKTVKR